MPPDTADPDDSRVPESANAIEPATLVAPADLHDPYAALRVPGFRRYLFGNIFALIGMKMQAMAVAWEIYQRTRSNEAMAMIGLIQVLPVLFLSLPAGHLADRTNRKRIVLCSLTMTVIGSLGLAAVSTWQLPISILYGCLFFNGVARALQQPAKASMLPQIVPAEVFPNAVAWHGSGFQLASVAGPGVAGLLIALYKSAALVYAVEAAASLVFLILLTGVTVRPQIQAAKDNAWRSFADGIQFVWRTKIILCALSLDLFAVLLGGATMLLPVFAQEVLHVGAVGLGWLDAAPACGALATAFLIAHRRPFEKAGRTLLWSVVGFGIATIVFGLSRSYWLSLSMLVLTGAFDMVSVVVRHTLVQLLTPDQMRGRVSAVNGMFIGASNELGGFESAMVAAMFDRPTDRAFGPIVSVVSGGIGTIVIVLLAALKWPQIRRYGRLGAPPPPE